VKFENTTGAYIRSTVFFEDKKWIYLKKKVDENLEKGHF
jgi:hypothetical protein